MEGGPAYFNRYAYVGNNPVNAIDRDRKAIETLWDAANVVAGLVSAGGNVLDGNFGAAAFDLGGVVVDAAATVVPFVPGGAATRIKAARTGSKALNSSKKAGAAAERAKNIEKGVPESQLGPSGKPKQHTVNHSQRKPAHQATKKEADRNGGKVRNDANPSTPKQGPHFQAEDAAGNNVKPVVHHERPKK